MSKLNEWSAENLERAAKFMRELDKSVNAKAAMELARREQDVDLAREATKSKEAEAQRAAQMSQLEKIRWEEQRKTLEAKRENEKVSNHVGRPCSRAGLAIERLFFCFSCECVLLFTDCRLWPTTSLQNSGK
jgi:hypothetical protein